MLKTTSHAPGARRGFFVLWGHSAIRSILPNTPHKRALSAKLATTERRVSFTYLRVLGSSDERKTL